ncbi:MAG TPA: hypothetical protein VI728_06535 [Syntrophales bacterium]|nr:hypothetical protein [Syntrophales bacterium]
MTVLMLTMLCIGCARPPKAEKAAAKTAMDAALSAGADKYAAADFAAARELWDASEAQVNEKSTTRQRSAISKPEQPSRRLRVVSKRGRRP